MFNSWRAGGGRANLPKWLIIKKLAGFPVSQVGNTRKTSARILLMLRVFLPTDMTGMPIFRRVLVNVKVRILLALSI
jgi:hypothetical protein